MSNPDKLVCSIESGTVLRFVENVECRRDGVGMRHCTLAIMWRGQSI